MSPSKLTPEQETIVGKHYLDGLTAKEISEYIPKYGAIRSYIKRAVSAGKLPRRCDIGKEKEPATAATVTSPEISSTDEIINTIIIPHNEANVKEIPEIVMSALVKELENLRCREPLLVHDYEDVADKFDKVSEALDNVRRNIDVLAAYIERLGGAV